MRTLIKLMTVAAAAATISAMAVVPAAMADPPAGVTPRAQDITGTGSDTIEFVLDQLSNDYNKTVKASAPHLYSWDATNPLTGAIGDTITVKKGCKPAQRPDGSSAGILALTTENGTTSGHPCLDYARSSRNRAPTDPVYGKGGISFITLAGDAVTYATQPGSNAPSTLTPLQLFDIYSCKYTTWSQVGVKGAAGKQKIKAYIPQSSSGTRAFFLTAIGFPSGASPGTCVSDEATKADPGGRLEENEGVNSGLNTDKPNVIFPYSIGKYVAERYHSAKCLNHFCTQQTSGTDKGKVCLPKAGQNEFGCDSHGTMVLNSINGTAPTSPFPLPSKCSKTCPVVNKDFTPIMTRSLYVVVPFGTDNGIPPYLAPLFGPDGFTCTSKVAKADLQNYGFIVFPKGTSSIKHSIQRCGDTH
ncbi:MAG TPA: substrate-binding domain-containing protein [Streptosporangiaceae bacterium]|nr:substrate-binding domain-containing protein [Streptosporangiaceae bacterium]